MKVSDLTRELRRIARREVPNGEPNLWPAIRQQLERAGACNESRRSSADLDSSYVWHADAPRRRRFGTLPAALAGALVLVLLVAGLALALGNRSRPGQPAAIIGGLATPPAATGSPTSGGEGWTSSGALTIPLVPTNGSNVGGTVNTQIMPGGDLRISINLTTPTDPLVWRTFTPAYCSLTPDGRVGEPEMHAVIPSFIQSGYAFVPAAKTHQTITLSGARLSDGQPVACATIPMVPTNLTVTYAAASDVPATCPVTLPGTTLFTPPGVSPNSPHTEYGDYWFGNPKLWTALSLDGVWNGGKSFWWSEGYNAWTEQRPDLTVTGKRLDGPGSATVDRATNGMGGGAGSFMLVGVDFPTTGCWQVTGAYKGETVSFVVWVDHSAKENLSSATAAATIHR
jgi:hypothetical protein